MLCLKVIPHDSNCEFFRHVIFARKWCFLPAHKLGKTRFRLVFVHEKLELGIRRKANTDDDPVVSPASNRDESPIVVLHGIQNELGPVSPVKFPNGSFDLIPTWLLGLYVPRLGTFIDAARKQPRGQSMFAFVTHWVVHS